MPCRRTTERHAVVGEVLLADLSTTVLHYASLLGYATEQYYNWLHLLILRKYEYFLSRVFFGFINLGSSIIINSLKQTFGIVYLPGSFGVQMVA